MMHNRYYKYMRTDHAKLLLDSGTLRIGTLYDYRATETHGTAIGDNEEGTKTQTMDVAAAAWTHDNQPEFGRHFIKLAPGANVNLFNVGFARTEHAPNCFVFSFSVESSQSIMKRLNYDSCVRIVQMQQMIKQLSRCIADIAEFQGVFDCVYTNRRCDHSKKMPHPALIKDPNYYWQKELRAIWKPKKDGIEPQIITCPSLKNFCFPHTPRNP